MQQRTRRWAALAVTSGLVLVAAAVWLWGTSVGINRNGYRRIAEGMTLEEVNALLGKPPGDYRSRDPELPAIDESERLWWNNGRAASGDNWLSDEGAIWVGFSEDGKAVGKHFLSQHEGPGSVLGWLRARWRW